MCKIRARETRILLIRRWLQQADGVHPLAAFGLDQITAAEDLGNAQLGRLELEVLDPHDNINDRVRTLDAGAEGSALALVPAPGGVVVRVIGVRATDVRRAVLPRDAECAEHLRLAAFDCRLD
jgi:hypothetical protein